MRNQWLGWNIGKLSKRKHYFNDSNHSLCCRVTVRYPFDLPKYWQDDDPPDACLSCQKILAEILARRKPPEAPNAP